MRGVSFATAWLCFALTGCVETDQPPFGAGDVVFEPAILGDWESVTDPIAIPVGKIEKTTFRVTAGKDSSYTVTPQAKDQSPKQIWLFKLGDRFFAAQRSTRFLSDTKDLAYSVWRVIVRGSDVELWDLDFDRLLKANPRLASVRPRVAGAVGLDLLDGPTSELRALFAAHSDDPGVWTMNLRYRKVGGLKLTEGGLPGKKQRTLDYWSLLRYRLQTAPLSVEGGGILGWSEPESRIKEFSSEGVDATAVTAGAAAATLCEALGEHALNHIHPSDPFTARLRLTTGGSLLEPIASPDYAKIAATVRATVQQLEESRVKLANIYKAEFLPIK